MIVEPISNGALREVVERALREDIGLGDVTTGAIVPVNFPGEGTLLAKANGVLSGLAVAATAFAAVDPAVEVHTDLRDGMPLLRGSRIAAVRGPVAAMLTAERTALNFLQRMSGIATATAAYVRLVEGLPVRILDTRKTAPLLRAFDRQAVRDGRGTNHRFGLDDMILIKDNHIAAAGSVTEAVALARRARGDRPLAVEVETRTLAEALEAARCDGVDIVMLDNFPLDDMDTAVRLLRRARPGLEIEASGSVTESTVRAIAETGVDRISVGALTHSVRALDISFAVATPS